MRKFLMSALLIFGLMSSQAEAEGYGFLYECNNCHKTQTIVYDGDPSRGIHPDDWGLAYGCQSHPQGRHVWACVEQYDPAVGPTPPEERARRAAEREKAMREAAEKYERERAEEERRRKEEAARRIKMREDATESVIQADNIYKTKNYAASTQAYQESISIDPYNGHTHYMLAKSLYHDKTNKNKDFDLIIKEMYHSLELAENNDQLADYYLFLAKVFRHLGVKHLFNDRVGCDYLDASTQCSQMAQALRPNNGFNLFR